AQMSTGSKICTSAAALAALLLAFQAGAIPVVAFAASASTNDSAAKDSGVPDASQLPPFKGRTLDGKSLSTSSFSGKRLVLLCFNPGIEQAATYARAIQNIASEQSRYNFEIAGVALGLDPAGARAFAQKLGLKFPTFADSDSNIALLLGLQSPLALIGTDAEGRVGMAIVSYEHEPELPASAIDAR